MSCELAAVIGLGWRDIVDQTMWIAMGAAATALPSSTPHDTALAWIAILREQGDFVMPVAEGDPRINDAPLMQAYEELRALLADPCVPEGVISACLRLSECQTKLFCTHVDGHRARDRAGGTESGALGKTLRLEPSNLLSELLAALRAFEWPRVLVLVHSACSTREAAV